MDKEPANIKSIFYKALKKKNADELTAYLDSACGNDAELRAEVESLLKSHENAADFLPSPDLDPMATLDDAPLTEGPGTVIGRYKLLEQIGEGGFGVVYMAEQTKPIIRRVAFKIIKLGMDTKAVIARFEAERQALAMMEHPNIAKVLDAGATDTGRPYFVMELVKGIPITEYCDTNNLDTQKRLELFIDVCKAVQHAHQKKIIHRDIKPSNVLITLHDGKPVPKVIDFGIAKATAQRLTEKTLFTRFAQMIGTPEYMSPEQAEFSGLDVDARSDIYSLGVLLYQLLTGVTPFDAETLREAGYGEMQRIIREEEPDKPSTRLSVMGKALTDVAKHRQASPDVLQKLVRGDLDWIVMKTLEKDRTRRYERAVELAADVQRHLNHEPVQAVSPSISYRLRKFVRRNRVAVITFSLIIAALAIGATIATLTLLGSGRLTEMASESEFAREIREHLEKLDGGIAAKLVWTYPTLMQAMAPSPDGHYIAFVDEQTGDLAVRDLKTGENRRLTHNKVPFEGTTYFVRFSPDGRWIAYNWIGDENDRKKADLRIMGIDGSGSRIVYQPDEDVRRMSPHAWFPDGKRILVRLTQNDETRQVVVVSIEDGSIRVIEGPDREYEHLSLSPDGRYIAYDFSISQRSGLEDEDIAMLAVDGGPEIPVIEHPADDDLLGWAPDGKTLLFRRNRRGEEEDLWVIQIVDGKPQGPPQLVMKGFDEGNVVIGDGQFTPDGSFYYTGQKPQQRSTEVCIATFEPDTGRIQSPVRPVTQRSDTRWPAWSPDGKSLAYYSSSEGGGHGIVVIRSMETGQEREIPLETEYGILAAFSMRWSPDGRSILTSQPDGGLAQLDVASGKFTPIVPPSVRGTRPAGWSPDGKKIFYGRYDDSTIGTQMLVRNLENGEETEFYRGQGTASISPSFALSPDGRQVAFGSPWHPAMGVGGLYVIPTTGGEPRELLREPDSQESGRRIRSIRGRQLEWTPDGRYVLFTRGNSTKGGFKADVWRIAVEGGRPEHLGTLPASLRFSLGMRVHPDGKRIAFYSMSRRTEPELRVIENLLPGPASSSVQLPDM